MQDVLEKVGSIPDDILSLITSKILIGLTYLHRQKHMVRPFCWLCVKKESCLVVCKEGILIGLTYLHHQKHMVHPFWMCAETRNSWCAPFVGCVLGKTVCVVLGKTKERSGYP
jgi:hypothetical protein